MQLQIKVPNIIWGFGFYKNLCSPANLVFQPLRWADPLSVQWHQQRKHLPHKRLLKRVHFGLFFTRLTASWGAKNKPFGNLFPGCRCVKKPNFQHVCLAETETFGNLILTVSDRRVFDFVHWQNRCYIVYIERDTQRRPTICRLCFPALSLFTKSSVTQRLNTEYAICFLRARCAAWMPRWYAFSGELVWTVLEIISELRGCRNKIFGLLDIVLVQSFQLTVVFFVLFYHRGLIECTRDANVEQILIVFAFELIIVLI